MIERQLKRAFIATVAAGAVGVAAGCDNFWDEQDCGFECCGCEPDIPDEPPDVPERVCPSAQPASGLACPEIGMTCSWGDFECDEVWAECALDGWRISYSSCNPPAATCPEERPEIGSPCVYEPDTIDGYPSWCEYYAPSPCGGLLTVFSCEYEIDGPVVWAQLESQDTCALPPERCHEYTDGGQCADDAGCQWLAPGCFDEGGEQPIPLGCYPVGDCAAVGCDSWGTCITGIFDPCAGQKCNACGAEATVCAAVAP